MKSTSAESPRSQRALPLEPASVAVASAKIRGAIDLEATAPTTLRLRPGQAVHLRFQYAFEESSRARETYRFRLRCTLDGKGVPDAHAQWGDRKGLPDGLIGSVVVTASPKPGRSQLKFTAEAIYGQGSWGSQDETQTRRKVDGTITLIVEEPARPGGLAGPRPERRPSTAATGPLPPPRQSTFAPALPGGPPATWQRMDAAVAGLPAPPAPAGLLVGGGATSAASGPIPGAPFYVAPAPRLGRPAPHPRW